MIYESTHYIRTITKKFARNSPEQSVYASDIKYIVRNCTERMKPYDISEYKYNNPMELVEKYKSYFTNELLDRLQQVNKYFQQTYKTSDSSLLLELYDYLRKNKSYFKYLLQLIKWVESNFPPIFALSILDLLRPGNTYFEWVKIENQIKHRISKNGKKYIINFPGYVAPINMYRQLLAACDASSHFVPIHSLHSHRMLQFQLVSFFLLSVYIIFVSS